MLALAVGETNAPGGYMAPEFYNQLVAMHGTVMIFLAVVPLLTGAFGNYLVPLADRRERHGVPPAQRRQLLDLPRGRAAHAALVLRHRRRREFGMDLVSAARHPGDAAGRTSGSRASSCLACRRC